MERFIDANYVKLQYHPMFAAAYKPKEIGPDIVGPPETIGNAVTPLGLHVAVAPVDFARSTGNGVVDGSI